MEEEERRKRGGREERKERRKRATEHEMRDLSVLIISSPLRNVARGKLDQARKRGWIENRFNRSKRLFPVMHTFMRMPLQLGGFVEHFI